jgi:outer membrane protein OmpA-like peptidoglycan-associated protein
MRRSIQLAVALLAALPAIVRSDALEERLFAPAVDVRTRAEAVQASLLAPQSYGKGIAAFDRAREVYGRDGAGEKFQELLGEAQRYLRQSLTNAEQAQRAFASVLQTREAARTAEAFRLAPTRFAAAERQLQDAARQLEEGDEKDARERGETARQSYSDAELEAIKAALLTEARAAVVAMDAADAERRAPKTVARARALLQQAEDVLSRDRQQKDEAERLAGHATMEAKHAVALAAMLGRAEEQEATPEDLVRKWEEGLTRTAAAAGASLDFSAGPEGAAEGLTRTIEGLRRASEQQASELAERQQQITALEEEIRDLDARLSGASSEARTLTLQLEARERVRQQLRQLEQLFTPEEASVVRESDRVIVRLKGLSFASGSSSLTSAAKRLMEKVRQAIAIFPSGTLIVEGHTDSSGNSGANQRLSQSRADAVRAYMLDVLKVSAGRVRAVGYGDGRPIASNSSADGRRQNRRIDLVIPVKAGDAF